MRFNSCMETGITVKTLGSGIARVTAGERFLGYVKRTDFTGTWYAYPTSVSPHRIPSGQSHTRREAVARLVAYMMS